MSLSDTSISLGHRSLPGNFAWVLVASAAQSGWSCSQDWHIYTLSSAVFQLQQSFVEMSEVLCMKAICCVIFEIMISDEYELIIAVLRLKV